MTDLAAYLNEIGVMLTVALSTVAFIVICLGICFAGAWIVGSIWNLLFRHKKFW